MGNRSKTNQQKKVKRKKTKKKPNWQDIEKEYRVGQLSNRALARKYNVPVSTLRGRIKKEEWQRDLREAFDQALSTAIVKETAQENTQTAQRAESDDDTVQAAVGTSIDVIKKHRRHIVELHKLADKAYSCIEEIFLDKSIDRHDWMFGTGRESMLGMLQKFSIVREKAILLERQAYNLDKKDHLGGNAAGFDLENRIKQRMDKLKTT